MLHQILQRLIHLRAKPDLFAGLEQAPFFRVERELAELVAERDGSQGTSVLGKAKSCVGPEFWRFFGVASLLPVPMPVSLNPEARD